mmetsp:Transcript_2631/g.5610  ORF Transcript_2631/g.5610 Transcript_2631/m.5610 type:complete len:104 (-) Transcript_2631:2-313(-)
MVVLVIWLTEESITASPSLDAVPVPPGTLSGICNPSMTFTMPCGLQPPGCPTGTETKTVTGSDETESIILSCEHNTWANGAVRDGAAIWHSSACQDVAATVWA